MGQLVRSGLVAAAIAVAIALVMGWIFDMGGSGTAVFALVMAAFAFVGTLVISSFIKRSHRGHPQTP